MILVQRSIWAHLKVMLHTFVLDSIEHLSWCLAHLIIQKQSICGLGPVLPSKL